MNAGVSVDELVSFLRSFYKEAVLELASKYPKEQTTLFVSWRDLHAFDPDMADRYISEPDGVTEQLTEALQQYDLPVDVSFDQARVCIRELPEPEIHSVGSPLVSDIAGEVKGVRGQISKQSQKKQKLATAVFDCQRCGMRITIPQTQLTKSATLTEPQTCQGCDRQGPFTLNTNESTMVDHQTLRLQTPPEDSDDGSTDSMDVILRGDLVGDVSPGDRVIANSLVELVPESDDSLIYEPVGLAESIDRLDGDYEDIDAAEHMDRIREIANSDDPVQRVVDSIAPTHEGDEEIKEALALQLFGGVDKTRNDGSGMRGTTHILLIGDPGSGKSSLLDYMANLSPRSVTATGKGSTAAGLTAAAVKDDFGSNSWTLEAGALVEANGGVCAIDELDDMDGSDRKGLLRAMSEQNINISKAGINAKLPANTTVLAAANPIYGRFNEYEPIAEQFDLDPALISRFDLIFPIQDKPDEDLDARIADTKLDSAKAGQQRARGLSTDESAPAPDIEPEVLRAYVAHAKSTVPIITDETHEMIRSQYLELRQSGGDGHDDPISVTPRMLEALIRLSEASARIRLSDEIGLEDAQRAARIHHKYLRSVGVDPETGEFDVDIVETGNSKTQRDRIQSVRGIIEEIAEEHEKGAPIDVVKETIEAAGIGIEKFERDVEAMKEKGKLYEPSNGYLRPI